jgi:hypothetical protein
MKLVRTLVLFLAGACLLNLPSPAFAQCTDPTSLIVDKHLTAGAGVFNKIGDALSFIHNSCRSGSGIHFTVNVHAGEYNDEASQLGIDVPRVTLRGESRDRVILNVSQVKVTASDVTISGLTIQSNTSGYEAISVDLAGGKDNVQIADCHVKNATLGVAVYGPTDSLSENIVVKDSLIEAKYMALDVESQSCPSGSCPPGHIDFTSQNNTYVAHASNGEVPIAVQFRTLDEAESRVRSLNDRIDLTNTNSSIVGSDGNKSIDGYFFLPPVPIFAEIVNPEIRLAYVGGGANRDYFGVEVHGAGEGPQPGNFPHVITLSHPTVHIDDSQRTETCDPQCPPNPPPYNNCCSSAAGALVGLYLDKVKFVVSGGSITYASGIENLQRVTLGEIGSNSPYGIVYAGIQVDGVAYQGGSGTIAPFDQYQLRASGGLVGASGAVKQVDSLVSSSSAEPITGDWTFSGHPTFSNTVTLDNASTFDILQFKNGTLPIWGVNSASNLTFHTNVYGNVGVWFQNDNLNAGVSLIVGNSDPNAQQGGAILPGRDGLASLGFSDRAFGESWVHWGHFDTYLNIPYKTQDFSLNDGMVAVDARDATHPRICYAAGGKTYCVKFDSAECYGSNCP